MAEAKPPSSKGASVGRLTNVVQCPHHPHAPLIEDHAAGDMICPECGLVVGDRWAVVDSDVWIDLQYTVWLVGGALIGKW